MMEITDTRYFALDSKGWIYACDRLEELSDRLDWSDVKTGEYLFIDSDGWKYQGVADEHRECGFQLTRKDEGRDMDTALVLSEYSDAERMSEENLKFCR